MNLDRPLIFFDVETTGIDPQKDRIISLHAVKFLDMLGGAQKRLVLLVNPGVPIPAESTEHHGITADTVQDCPSFKACACATRDFFAGCDLAGYNIRNFDIPILWEEFNRVGIDWDLAGVRVLDVCVIFRKQEKRDLSAALLFYVGKEHTSAHTAGGDVDATVDVFQAQLGYYPEFDGKSFAEMADFSRDDERIDLAGIINRDQGGFPVFGTKRNRGVRVHDDPGYAQWMLRSDFSEQTKAVIRRILKGETV